MLGVCFGAPSWPRTLELLSSPRRSCLPRVPVPTAPISPPFSGADGLAATPVELWPPKLPTMAHDVAALRLRGRETGLNFPGLVHQFRHPVTAELDDVRAVALEAAAQVRFRPDLLMQPVGPGGGDSNSSCNSLLARSAWLAGSRRRGVRPLRPHGPIPTALPLMPTLPPAMVPISLIG
ncbi:hypothetical protein PVAP13_2KG433400 [Panicum virgatum]|uniref:Uncharacterized protein n=1 Tax=Panicum virgatum TaxID=38727 RepID=A0A8T0WR15_PANVG|nr:hypothetical protein PVAP13_2KG433400 [Panicum virgatum]